MKAGQKGPEDRYQPPPTSPKTCVASWRASRLLARRIGPLERAWIWSQRRPWAATGVALSVGPLY